MRRLRAMRRVLRPSGNNHLPLEALLLVPHNVEVLQVQVKFVAPVAACSGHVPHHSKGGVPQHGRCCCGCRRGGAVGGAWIRGDGLWWGGEEGEREEEQETTQRHGCSTGWVFFLTHKEREFLIRLILAAVKIRLYWNWLYEIKTLPNQIHIVSSLLMQC